MKLDIGQVFSTSLAMVKQRFLSLLGIWCAYFLLGIVLFVGFFVAFGASAVGIGALLEEGLDSALAATGFGVTFILAFIAFYFVYNAVIFAHFASMTVMGSPVERPAFGEAFGRGLRAGLTLLALSILFYIVYFVAALIVGLVIGFASLASEAAGSALNTVLSIATIYFLCRFAVLVPVIAVERVYNPIKAVNRAWSITDGKVLRVFVVLLLTVMLGGALLALPLGLIASAGGLAETGLGDIGGGAAAAAVFGLLLIFPLFIVFHVLSAVITASLHAQISGQQGDQLSAVFE